MVLFETKRTDTEMYREDTELHREKSAIFLKFNNIFRIRIQNAYTLN